MHISVKRYKNPKAVGWAGWLEPEDKSWVMFVGLDGRPLVFLSRDTESGAILGDDPEKRESDLAELRSTGGLRIGMANDGSADFGGEPGPHALGEVIHPLGIYGGAKPE